MESLGARFFFFAFFFAAAFAGRSLNVVVVALVRPCASRTTPVATTVRTLRFLSSAAFARDSSISTRSSSPLPSW